MRFASFLICFSFWSIIFDNFLDPFSHSIGVFLSIDFRKPNYINAYTLSNVHICYVYVLIDGSLPYERSSNVLVMLHSAIICTGFFCSQSTFQFYALFLSILNNLMCCQIGLCPSQSIILGVQRQVVELDEQNSQRIESPNTGNFFHASPHLLFDR